MVNDFCISQVCAIEYREEDAFIEYTFQLNYKGDESLEDVAVNLGVIIPPGVSRGTIILSDDNLMLEDDSGQLIDIIWEIGDIEPNTTIITNFTIVITGSRNAGEFPLISNNQVISQGKIIYENTTASESKLIVDIVKATLSINKDYFEVKIRNFNSMSDVTLNALGKLWLDNGMAVIFTDFGVFENEGDNEEPVPIRQVIYGTEKITIFGPNLVIPRGSQAIFKIKYDIYSVMAGKEAKAELLGVISTLFPSELGTSLFIDKTPYVWRRLIGKIKYVEI